MTASLELRLPAAPESLAVARARLAGFLARSPFDADALFDLQVALSEACANVIQHARASEVILRFILAGREATVEVVDSGPGFDPLLVDQGSTTDGTSGRGFLLMRALTDRLDVTTTPAGTTVRLVKRAGPGGHPPGGPPSARRP